jgi:hypothetical protein
MSAHAVEGAAILPHAALIEPASACWSVVRWMSSISAVVVGATP